MSLAAKAFVTIAAAAESPGFCARAGIAAPAINHAATAEANAPHLHLRIFPAVRKNFLKGVYAFRGGYHFDRKNISQMHNPCLNCVF